MRKHPSVAQSVLYVCILTGKGGLEKAIKAPSCLMLARDAWGQWEDVQNQRLCCPVFPVLGRKGLCKWYLFQNPPAVSDNG